MRLRHISPPFLAGAAAVFILLSSCGEESPDKPIGATPGGPTVTTSASPLHEARLDLAKRLNLDPQKVALKELKEAGWDGCLGVEVPGQACTMIFMGGYIGFFEANGKRYRYHFGGRQFVATDFVNGTARDGSPVPPELMPDFSALLAAYVRFDLGLRIGKPGSDIVTQWIIPTTFTNTCLDIAGALGCAPAAVPGAFVSLVEGTVSHTYLVGVRGGAVYLGKGAASPVNPNPPGGGEVTAAQLEMRQDLAKRLAVPVETISIITFHRVTWSDGCVGVYPAGRVCTQALVEGFFALLADGGGKQYEYHGSGSGFVAATFEPGADIRRPDITQGR